MELLAAIAGIVAFVFHPQSGKNMDWVFITEGELVNIRMNNLVSVNETSAYVTCGLQSLGLIRVASYLVQEHLCTGKLVAVLEAFSEPSVPVSGVNPVGNRASITVRAFTEWVGELFARRVREESVVQDERAQGPMTRVGHGPGSKSVGNIRCRSETA